MYSVGVYMLRLVERVYWKYTSFFACNSFIAVTITAVSWSLQPGRRRNDSPSLMKQPGELRREDEKHELMVMVINHECPSSSPEMTLTSPLLESITLVGEGRWNEPSLTLFPLLFFHRIEGP